MRFLLRDLRFGLRTLIKTPLLTVRNCAFAGGGHRRQYSGLHGYKCGAVAPVSVSRSRADRQHYLKRISRKENGGTLLRYELVRDYNKSFQSVAVWTSDNLNLTGNGEPIQVPIARVSPGLLPMLAVQPQLGRVFTQEEGSTAGRSVVILSDAIWRTRYHSDPGIIGSVVTLDSVATTVVGVLPADARFPFMPKADIFTPRYFELSLITPQRLRMGVGYLNMIARLRRGVTISEANHELALLNQRYREQNPTAPGCCALNRDESREPAR